MLFVFLFEQSDSTIYNVYAVININEVYDIKLSLIMVMPFGSNVLLM